MITSKIIPEIKMGRFAALAVLSALFMFKAFAVESSDLVTNPGLNDESNLSSVTQCHDDLNCSSICRSIYPRRIAQEDCLQLSVKNVEAVAVVDEIFNNGDLDPEELDRNLNIRDFAFYISISDEPLNNKVFTLMDFLAFEVWILKNHEKLKGYEVL